MRPRARPTLAQLASKAALQRSVRSQGQGQEQEKLSQYTAPSASVRPGSPSATANSLAVHPQACWL